jgi:putative membrane protein
MKRLSREPVWLLLVGGLCLWVSGIRPYDRFTWLLEVLPILLAVPILIATRRGFLLTPLVYRLIFLHALILMLGGHYTYARVPLGFWAQDLFHLARNHYDRLGHLAQGFVPALVIREVLLRVWKVPRGSLLFLVVALVCLGLSAFYEFTEWWAAVVYGESANAFLGTQGDVWDTQWDMFMALLGAVAAQALFGRVQDRQIAALPAA